MKKVTFNTPAATESEAIELALTVLNSKATETQDFQESDGDIVEYDLTENNDPTYWSVSDWSQSSLTLDC